MLPSYHRTKNSKFEPAAQSLQALKKGMIIFMNIVETNNLKKYYGKDPNITKALDGVSLSISKGSFTAIVGTSGSGKTTLLNMLGGLDTPTEGTVIIGEKQIHSMNDEQLTIFRRRNIGFVFQNYNLVPILNIYENIMLPSDLDGDTVDKSYFEKIVQLLGLREKLYNMPNQLSGGQQQRVAIARALVGKPAILLADEPTGNLDSKSSANVMEILKQANLSFGQTIVMITHNELLAQMADTIIRIEDGRIAESR